MEITHQNHFKFGYDNQWFVPRTSRFQQWTCQYGIVNNILSVKEANRRAALLIGKQAVLHNKKIFLMLSGGADSEVAARAFIDANVPFTAALLEYRLAATKSKVENQFELENADKLINEYQIPFIRHTLDPERFWHSSELSDIAKISMTSSPQLAVTMWFARYLSQNQNAFVVLGQGEPYIYRQFGSWWFREKELIGSWSRFWYFDKIYGTAGFHQYTPEQMLAYLTDPVVTEFMSSNIGTVNEVANNAMIKHRLYQHHYPESNLINRTKYHGFEQLFWQEWEVRARLKEQFPFGDDVYTVEYNKMVDCLLGKELW